MAAMVFSGKEKQKNKNRPCGHNNTAVNKLGEANATVQVWMRQIEEQEREAGKWKKAETH